MGGIHGKTKTNEQVSQIERTSNASNVIDGGIGSTISMNQITGSDIQNLNLVDHESVDKAFSFAESVLGEGASFLENSMEMVQESSQRNYDFAETVAIPLNAQATSEFQKYIIGAVTIISIAYFYNMKKRRK